MSHLPRRDAHRRLHHPDVGDRPDPHPPPDPRFPCGARRATEPPIDPGPREPGPGAPPTLVRRRGAGPLRTAPTLRHHAGTVGVGGRPAGAAHWSRRHRPPTVTAVPTALESHEHVSGHAAARQSVRTRSVISPYTRPIVDPPRLKFLSPAGIVGAAAAHTGTTAHAIASSNRRNPRRSVAREEPGC